MTLLLRRRRAACAALRIGGRRRRCDELVAASRFVRDSRLRLVLGGVALACWGHVHDDCVWGALVLFSVRCALFVGLPQQGPEATPL